MAFSTPTRDFPTDYVDRMLASAAINRSPPSTPTTQFTPINGRSASNSSASPSSPHPATSSPAPASPAAKRGQGKRKRGVDHFKPLFSEVNTPDPLPHTKKPRLTLTFKRAESSEEVASAAAGAETPPTRPVNLGGKAARWTKEEDETLGRLRAEGASRKVIEAALPERTWISIRQRKLKGPGGEVKKEEEKEDAGEEEKKEKKGPVTDEEILGEVVSAGGSEDGGVGSSSSGRKGTRSFRWTKEEDAVVEREVAAFTAAADIAEMLDGRTVKAVRARIVLLRVWKRNELLEGSKNAEVGKDVLAEQLVGVPEQHEEMGVEGIGQTETHAPTASDEVVHQKVIPDSQPSSPIITTTTTSTSPTAAADVEIPATFHQSTPSPPQFSPLTPVFPHPQQQQEQQTSAGGGEPAMVSTSPSPAESLY